MKVEFNRYFFKDLGKISDASVKSAVADIIEVVELATNLSQVSNLKKLKGFKTAYRIRVGDYRIGIVVIRNVVEFVRVVNRNMIYKLFP